MPNAPPQAIRRFRPPLPAFIGLKFRLWVDKLLDELAFKKVDLQTIYNVFITNFFFKDLKFHGQQHSAGKR